MKSLEYIEKNTFENAIKDNKLEFNDDEKTDSKKEEKPDLSPTAVEDGGSRPSIEAVLKKPNKSDNQPQINQHDNSSNLQEDDEKSKTPFNDKSA